MSLKDNCLELITSDGIISIRERLMVDKENDMQISAEGSVVLQSKILVDGVSKITSDIIEIEVISGSKVAVRGGRAEFFINGFSSLMYPDISFELGQKQFNIDSSEFISLTDKVISACSDPGDRPILSGMNLNIEKGAMYFTGSNTYRIARVTHRFPIDINMELTIPLQVLVEIAKHHKGIITVAASNVEAFIKTETTIVKSRLLDGIFPKVDKFIPEEFSNEISIRKELLVQAIERSSLMRTEGSWMVTLTIKSNVAVLSTNAGELGSTEEELETIEVRAENGFMKFNGQYALDALKTIGSETVKIKFNSNIKPFSFVDTENSDLVQLVTPIRPEA